MMRYRIIEGYAYDVINDAMEGDVIMMSYESGKAQNTRKRNIMSMGVLLNNGFLMCGSSAKIVFYHRSLHSSVLETFPHMPGQTVFWLTAQFSSQQSLLAKSTVFTIDYDL